jgi:hypothetical protein
VLRDSAKFLSHQAGDVVTIGMRSDERQNCSDIMNGVEYPLPGAERCVSG